MALADLHIRAHTARNALVVIAVVVGMVVFGILDAVFNLTTGLRGQMSGNQ